MLFKDAHEKVNSLFCMGFFYMVFEVKFVSELIESLKIYIILEIIEL